jgi:hypothetical protein
MVNTSFTHHTLRECFKQLIKKASTTQTIDKSLYHYQYKDFPFERVEYFAAPTLGSYLHTYLANQPKMEAILNGKFEISQSTLNRTGLGFKGRRVGLSLATTDLISRSLIHDFNTDTRRNRTYISHFLFKHGFRTRSINGDRLESTK